MKHNSLIRSASALAILAIGSTLTTASAAENTDRSQAEPACRSSSVIFCENWENGDWFGWRDYNVADSLNKGGFRGGDTCAQGCTLPYPGYDNSRAVAIKLPKDQPDGIYPRNSFNRMVDANDTLYARWRAYWSPNFHFNYQNTKHFYLLSNARTNNGGGGNYRVAFQLRPATRSDHPSSAVPYVQLYKTQVEVAAGSWQSQTGENDIRYFPNQAGTGEFRIRGGQWYEFEMRVTPNPRGSRFGGRIQFWIDGELMADYSDNVSIRKANEMDILDGVWLSSYFGGGGQSTHPEQYVVYDDIIVSKERIGPVVVPPPLAPTSLRAK